MLPIRSPPLRQVLFDQRDGPINDIIGDLDHKKLELCPKSRDISLECIGDGNTIWSTQSVFARTPHLALFDLDLCSKVQIPVPFEICHGH
jgi:hypothetical protein